MSLSTSTAATTSDRGATVATEGETIMAKNTLEDQDVGEQERKKQLQV